MVGWRNGGSFIIAQKLTPMIQLLQARYLGRGHFCTSEETVNFKQKDTDDGSKAVDPMLSSALKIRRILDKILSKQFRHRSVEIDLEIRNLWTKAARIASSDCKVSQTVRLRLYRDVPRY